MSVQEKRMEEITDLTFELESLAYNLHCAIQDNRGIALRASIVQKAAEKITELAKQVHDTAYLGTE